MVNAGSALLKNAFFMDVDLLMFLVLRFDRYQLKTANLRGGGMATKAVREDFLPPASPQDSFSELAGVGKSLQGKHAPRWACLSHGAVSAKL
jgi:hypothetical protein